MLNDKQSLMLCGFIAGLIFITGVIDILNNFVVLTILTIAFLAVIINIFYTAVNAKKEDNKDS